MRSRRLICHPALPKATPPRVCSDAPLAFYFLHVNLSNPASTDCWLRCAGEGQWPGLNVEEDHSRRQRDQPVAGRSLRGRVVTPVCGQSVE